MITNRSYDDTVRGRGPWLFALVVALTVAASAASAAAPAQKTFVSPDDAASALVQAVKSRDRAAVLAVLGNAGEWVSSGDRVADRAAGDRFVAAYEAKHSVAVDGKVARLTVGADDVPFAFPIVRSGERWRFDTAAGKDEMLARRIGRNELDAINVLQAIVDAQREYAAEDRNGDGVLAYARKFASSPGKRDGLYWPVKADEAASPLGDLVAQASSEGYRKKDKGKEKGRDAGPRPYRGYYYRMLEGQGRNASSGPLDYVVRGRAIGGFGVVAWPAKYGNSGVMTFIVNQDGKVYQSDLGPATAEKAAAMRRFDPGPGWAAVATR